MIHIFGKPVLQGLRQHLVAVLGLCLFTSKLSQLLLANEQGL